MADYIVVKDIEKNFKGETILNKVNARFEEGKITGIIGKNGSGKSVLLKIICGLLRADGGELIINGELMGEYRKHPENIGAVIETTGFIPYKSGYKNLKYLADIQKKIGKDDVKAAIAMVGLDPDSKKHVGKYSLGMRQRLGIAQALMENPDLIILDEPMNGLDKGGIEDVRKLLKDLESKGKTIIITSHNAEDIDILCSSVYEIDRGDMTQVR